MMLGRKFLQIIHNKRCFESCESLRCFKYGSKRFPRKTITWNYNAPQCTYSTLFQNLLHQYDISFNNLKIQQHITFLLKEFKETEEKLRTGGHSVKDLKKLVSNLEPLAVLNHERANLTKQVEELDLFISDLQKQKDDELLNVAQQERKALSECLHQCEMAILESLLPEAREDEKDIILELSAGVGGQEAMLFTKDIFDMYCKFATYKQWKWDIIRFDETGIGGVRNAHISINGMNAYKALKFESGVHRVQRVPKTEKSGRIHTSTITVAILPQPTEIDIVIHPSEIETQCMRSSGAGGQHVNKVNTCVRLLHLPTGIAVESQVERCQHRNRELAMKILRAKLYKMKLDESIRETTSSRRLQVGTAARSDKVRTYNYLQDRITDHRIQKNMYNVEAFLQGGEQFEQLLILLSNWSSVEALNEILMKYE